MSSSRTGLSTFPPVRNGCVSCDTPAALGLDIVCTSPCSATSLSWSVENTSPLDLGIQGWSQLSSLPPQRTQCHSMQGSMGCQVIDLNLGSSAPTGLIPLEGDLVDMAFHVHQPFLTQGTALLHTFHHLGRW